MSEERIPTTEKLAKAMESHSCPPEMIKKAREGYYDDYKSSIATPCIQLVSDLVDAGKYVLAEKAKQGEFDAQKWESDEWAKGLDGRAAMARLPAELKAKLFGVFN